MDHHFSIEEALKFGWHKTKAHSGLLFQAMLTLFALQVASSIVTRVLEHTFMGIAASIVLGVVSLFVGVGFTIITLKLAKGESASYADIMPPVKLVWHYFVANILSGLFIVIGFILLIVPGIYLMLRYSMVRFAIIDGVGITDSLRRSASLTRGIKWNLLLFFIVIIMLNIVGAILLLVGLLVSVPVTMIAYAHVYQKLHAHHGAHHAH